MKFIFMIFCTVTLCGYYSSGLKVLGIFPFHVRSHFMMYEQTLKALARKGHLVDVVSPFPLKKPYPNYTDLFEFSVRVPELVNNLPFDALKGFISMDLPAWSLANLAGNNLCAEGLSLPGMQKLIHNPPNDYDLVITEMCAANCFFAFGEHFGVPVIAMSSVNSFSWGYDMVASPENLAFVQSIFLSFEEPLNFYARLYNTVHTIVNKVVFNYFTLEQDKLIKQHFGPNASGVRELESKLALFLINSHPTLIGNRPIAPALVDVGGLHAYDDDTRHLTSEVEKFLNKSTKGIVYVSFGSMMKIESLPVKVVKIFYESLGKLAPVRVLMKIAKPEELPSGLPDNILTSPWLPQIKVLKHKNVKVFVTHGGLMGTQEAITYGVPMIGIPLFADQFNNIDLYVKKNLAIKLDLEELTVEKFDDALNKILKDPFYAKTSKAFQNKFLDRPMSAVDTAVYWIEYVIRHGSDSLRSPAMDLTWWQVALLDVYLFLLFVISAILILITYTVKFIMRKIKNVFFNTHNKVD